MPSASSAKRKLDEKHYNILKDLLSLEYNKKCFDCGQRGPVYVNMTIGAFVCTSCSGQLRGLNPPHRVKSVSMASFTAEEMDFIQKRGNEACRYIWLSKFEPGIDAFPESKDEHKMRDHLDKKYERKLWYVPESKALAEYEANRTKKTSAEATSKSAASSSAIPRPSSTSGIKSSVSLSSSSMSVKSPQNANVTASQSVKPVQSASATKAKTLISQLPKDPFGDLEPVNDPVMMTHSASFDLFAPQTTSGQTTQVNSQVEKSFSANFDHLSKSTPTLTPVSQASTKSQNQQMLSTSTPPKDPKKPEDKYAVLASLDDEFKAAATKNSSLSWSDSLTAANPVTTSYGYSSCSPSSQSSNMSGYGSGMNMYTGGISGDQFKSSTIPSYAGNPFAAPQDFQSSGGFPNATQSTGTSSFAFQGSYIPMSNAGGSAAYAGNPFASPAAGPGSGQWNNTAGATWTTNGTSTDLPGTISSGPGSGQWNSTSSSANMFGSPSSNAGFGNFSSSTSSQFGSPGMLNTANPFPSAGAPASPNQFAAFTNSPSYGMNAGNIQSFGAHSTAFNDLNLFGAASKAPATGPTAFPNSGMTGDSGFGAFSGSDAAANGTTTGTGYLSVNQNQGWNADFGSFGGANLGGLANESSPSSKPTFNEGNPFL